MRDLIVYFAIPVLTLTLLHIPTWFRICLGCQRKLLNYPNEFIVSTFIFLEISANWSSIYW